MRKVLQAAIFAAVSLAFAGCGHISLSYLNKKETLLHKKFRKEGYDLCHLTSCGPDALSDAFKKFNINKAPLQIGMEIQDKDQAHYRCILGILHDGFYSITCPRELKRYIRSQGFNITETKDINQITQETISIFLLKGTDDLRDWHWITYPTNSKSTILNFFEENTKIKTIYILNKNE